MDDAVGVDNAMSYWVWTKANYDWVYAKAPSSIMHGNDITEVVERAGRWFMQDNPDAKAHRFFCHLDVKAVELDNPDLVRYFVIINGKAQELLREEESY